LLLLVWWWFVVEVDGLCEGERELEGGEDAEVRVRCRSSAANRAEEVEGWCGWEPEEVAGVLDD